MSRLTHRDEGQHGYLVKTRPRLKPTRQQLGAMFARDQQIGMNSVIAAEMIPEEIATGERMALDEIAMFGVLHGETGTDTVESCYDILGWEGGTYPGWPILFVGNSSYHPEHEPSPKPIEEELENLGLIDQPRPKEQRARRPEPGQELTAIEQFHREMDRVEKALVEIQTIMRETH